MADDEKKPLIYLFVILPILVGGGISIVIELVNAYAHVAGVSPSAVPNLNALFISLPAFFLWIPITLLLANCILFALPLLRKVAEDYVSRANRHGFADSRQLGKIALIMALFCLPLIILGFML